MTIVEFLEARLAEDELTAHAATDASPDWRPYYDYRDVKDLDGHFVVQADSRHPTTAQAAHIARHSPARALRECEAKTRDHRRLPPTRRPRRPTRAQRRRGHPQSPERRLLPPPGLRSCLVLRRPGNTACRDRNGRQGDGAQRVQRDGGLGGVRLLSIADGRDRGTPVSGMRGGEMTARGSSPARSRCCSASSAAALHRPDYRRQHGRGDGSCWYFRRCSIARPSIRSGSRGQASWSPWRTSVMLPPVRALRPPGKAGPKQQLLPVPASLCHAHLPQREDQPLRRS